MARTGNRSNLAHAHDAALTLVVGRHLHPHQNNQDFIGPVVVLLAAEVRLDRYLPTKAFLDADEVNQHVRLIVLARDG